MPSYEKLNSESKMSVGDNDLNSDQNLHAFGVSYISNFLNRVGFTILEVNTDPDHHFQLLVKINNKSLMIAVRTACHPDIGTIDSFSLETLIRESEELDVSPHFAGLSVKPNAKNEIDNDGSQEDQESKVIFNGISAVCKSEPIAVNG